MKARPHRLRAGRRVLLGSLLLYVAGVSASAQTPPASVQSLTLSSAVEEALRQRPLLIGDAERIAAAEARVRQAQSGLLPRIDFQASATDGPLGAPPLFLGGVVGTPIKRNFGASLNLVQTLLDFGRTSNTVRARRDEVDASVEVRHGNQNRVALEVQQSYLQALQAQRLLIVNRRILEQRELVARQAAALQQNGLASRVDVNLAELHVSQARLAVVRSQNEIEAAFAALSTAVGRPVPAVTELKDVVSTSDGMSMAAPPDGAAANRPAAAVSGLSLDESIAEALLGRPELRHAAAQVRGFEHLTAAARAEKRPLLTAAASIGKVRPVPLFESTDKPWAVGLAVTIPIFTGGLLDGRAEEARRNANAARALLGELENVVRQQVTGAVANLSATEQSLVVARSQVVQAEDVLSLATQRYQAQFGSIVELTQAQAAYATAQNDFVRALYDRELAQAALQFALGRSYDPSGAGRP